MAVEGVAAPGGARLINYGHLRWVGLAFAALAVAILAGNVFVLNFMHVMSGVLWTGIDIFVGFVLGPALRQTDIPARRAIAVRLIPRMLFLMPSLAIITGTAGYFLAQDLGFLDLPYPERTWVIAALVIITILTVQGLGICCRPTCSPASNCRRSGPISTSSAAACASMCATPRCRHRCRSPSSW